MPKSPEFFEIKGWKFSNCGTNRWFWIKPFVCVWGGGERISTFQIWIKNFVTSLWNLWCSRH